MSFWGTSSSCLLLCWLFSPGEQSVGLDLVFYAAVHFCIWWHVLNMWFGFWCNFVFLYLYFCTWWHVANVWFDFWCNWQDFWLKHFWHMMVIRTCQLLWFLYPHPKCDFNPIDPAKTTKNIEYLEKTKFFREPFSVKS